MNKEMKDFIYWAMDNCEVAEDDSLWIYESEEYSVDGLFKVYKDLKDVNLDLKNRT